MVGPRRCCVSKMLVPPCVSLTVMSGDGMTSSTSDAMAQIPRARIPGILGSMSTDLLRIVLGPVVLFTPAWLAVAAYEYCSDRFGARLVPPFVEVRDETSIQSIDGRPQRRPGGIGFLSPPASSSCPRTT